MKRTAWCVGMLAGFVGASLALAGDTPPAPAAGLRSATEFLSEDLQREQSDLAMNRGSLWVDQGRALWTAPPGAGGKSCAGCHGAIGTMAGVAARHPAPDPRTGDVLTLEMRINACRMRHQGLAGLAPESEALLALAAAIAVESRGLPVAVSIDGAARAAFARGKAWYETRQGQLDLACSQCHVDNVGRKLRGDTISSGLGIGYPAYRLEWNGLGSLHRRLRACQVGVRAVDLPFGSPEHVGLELYLASRARGMKIEAPAIRR